MAGPDMGTITASLERSLQNCSLNYHRESSSNAGGGTSRIGAGRSSSHHTPANNSSAGDATLELNSEISMPYHWEQCLDLETGEVYYINWRTGMKVKEDPRITKEYSSGEFYSEEEEDDDDGESCYDDDTEESGSSSEESTLSSSRDVHRRHHAENRPESSSTAAVLVVAGCKTCLMYFMVPKEVDDCPKCCGQLLHFDRSDNPSP